MNLVKAAVMLWLSLVTKSLIEFPITFVVKTLRIEESTDLKASPAIIFSKKLFLWSSLNMIAASPYSFSILMLF